MNSHRSQTIAAWILLAAALLATPGPALAQTGDAAETVTVALWPEYDRAEVLVIYRVLLAETVPLPARVRLPIPAEAPELAAVAYRDAAGVLLNAVHERRVGPGADLVDIETDGRMVQLEFYLPLQFHVLGAHATQRHVVAPDVAGAVNHRRHRPLHAREHGEGHALEHGDARLGLHLRRNEHDLPQRDGQEEHPGAAADV